MCEYKFYITTSLFEGNPKSILEAMGAGCVVIAPKNENNYEVIKDEFNGFLYDMSSIALITFTKNNDQLNTVSTNAFETIKKDYSLHSFVSQEIESLKTY